MARILISWGFCSAAVGLVGTSATIDAVLTRAHQFYLARFLLGLAEAGFYPGIIVYLTHWFSLPDRARAMSGLILGIPIALGLGAAISAAILQVHWFGYSGWRWLFILEGLPAVVLGLFTLFYLTDRPKHARWLDPDERDWIVDTLENERLAKQDTAHVTIWQSFRQRNVILLALALFSANLNSYTFVFWLPSVIEKHASGHSVTAATLYSGLPYALAILATIVVSYFSDRSGRRRFYAIVPMVVTGLALMASAHTAQPFWLADGVVVPGGGRDLCRFAFVLGSLDGDPAGLGGGRLDRNDQRDRQFFGLCGATHRGQSVGSRMDAQSGRPVGGVRPVGRSRAGRTASRSAPLRIAAGGDQGTGPHVELGSRVIGRPVPGYDARSRLRLRHGSERPTHSSCTPASNAASAGDRHRRVGTNSAPLAQAPPSTGTAVPEFAPLDQVLLDFRDRIGCRAVTGSRFATGKAPLFARLWLVGRAQEKSRRLPTRSCGSPASRSRSRRPPSKS